MHESKTVASSFKFTKGTSAQLLAKKPRVVQIIIIEEAPLSFLHKTATPGQIVLNDFFQPSVTLMDC